MSTRIFTTFRNCAGCGKGFQAKAEYTDGDDSGCMLVDRYCETCQAERERLADLEEKESE